MVCNYYKHPTSGCVCIWGMNPWINQIPKREVYDPKMQYPVAGFEPFNFGSGASQDKGFPDSLQK